MSNRATQFEQIVMGQEMPLYELHFSFGVKC